ncbi:hypothetical protein FSC37_15705 [Piscinibacter aquaticus]|uniref:Uncharacterized protein n=1 Tax=Piscinibacter aquaticus TaxID=392597 RepID=A0A5C6U1T2_9BURK|nr:hypothetical protein FSC37_15705 [Piscinibacter aquaticus]
MVGVDAVSTSCCVTAVLSTLVKFFRTKASSSFELPLSASKRADSASFTCGLACIDCASSVSTLPKVSFRRASVTS